MPRFAFSRIAILDSLGPNDLQTGRRLHEDIESYNTAYQRGARIDRFVAPTRAEFLACLTEIERNVQADGEYPTLHIECHGSDDTTGLVLASGEFVGWEDLKPLLTAINVASRCNLVITLAVCHGGYLSEIIYPRDRAPCAMLLGPLQSVKGGNVLRAFTAFYTTLISTLDGDQAMSAMRNSDPISANYSFISAEGFFKFVYARYLRQDCSLKGYWQRARSVRKKIQAEGSIKPPSLQSILQRFIKSERIFYEEAVELYFMMDLYPENRERFSVNYEEIHGVKR